MLPYLIIFLLSIIFTYFAEQSFKKRKKLIGFFMLAVPIFLMSLLAGFRGLDIGTDVKVYVKPIFDIALNCNKFSELLDIKTSTEPLYALLSFLVSRFTSNINVLMFIIEFIIMIFLCKGLYNHKEKSSMWCGMLIFCSLFYNRTLNITRQSIAIFIVFGFFNLLEEKKYLRFLFVAIIASFFHSSAIISIPMIFISMINKKNNNKVFSFIILIMIIFMLNYNNIIIFLIENVRILSSKYYTYLATGTIAINILDEVLRIILLGILLIKGDTLIKSKSDIENINNKLWKKFVIMDFIFVQLGMLALFASRGSWYYLTSYIIIIPEIVKKAKGDRRILNILIITIFSLYWVYSFGILNIGETVPYIYGINN